jgi:hypothetical protein
MLEPTNTLFELAKGKNVHYTFFVDVGYLIQAENYSELKSEVESVKMQIYKMIALNHAVQLHIHPHWEKATWSEGKWKMNVNGNYKLSDFTTEERTAIILNYSEYLENLIGKKINTFRAGGWCIQPFSELAEDFKKIGIVNDTSVIEGGFLQTANYNVDFTEAPNKSKYRFSDDVCFEDENGAFTEFPITSFRYRPSFYWWLYGLGKLFPSKHKMVGDGTFLSQGGHKWFALMNYSNHHISTDGYFAKKLNAGLEKSINLKHEEMVIIGHPKGNTTYSIKKLKRFIDVNQGKHEFASFENT